MKNGQDHPTLTPQAETCPSAIQRLDHNTAIQHFIPEFSIQIMSVSCNQNPSKTGIFWQGFYIGHQRIPQPHVLIVRINNDIAQIIGRGIVADNSQF